MDKPDLRETMADVEEPDSAIQGRGAEVSSGTKPPEIAPAVTADVLAQRKQVLSGNGFWGATLSNATAGLIVTYIVGAIAALVAIGGRHGAGTPIDWATILLFVLVGAVLGFNLLLLSWSVVRLIGAGAAEPGERTSTTWRLAAAITAITGFMWPPYGPADWWWWLLLTVVQFGTGAYSAFRPRAKFSARAGLVSGALGSVMMAVWMGVLLMRALG